MQIYSSFLVAFLLVPFSVAQTVTTLYVFNGVKGATLSQELQLTQGRDGKLYGTTFLGGSCGGGTAFRQSTKGGQSEVLHNFCAASGENPFTGLTLARDGNFYGGTANGGTYGFGTIFRMSPSGTFTVLYNFTGGADGRAPSAPLEATDGNLYGDTIGSVTGYIPIIYRLSPLGQLTIVYAAPANYDYFYSTPYQDSQGRLYAANTSSGIYGYGAVIRFSTNDIVTGTYSFDVTNGDTPLFPPIEGADGNLYGVTLGGGIAYGGVLYKIDSQSGFEIVLHNFGVDSGDGSELGSGVIQATDGALYGVATDGGTNNTGTIYQYTSEGTYNQVYSFPASGSQMQYPQGSFLQHTNGKLYGTTYGNGIGAIYSLDMGLAPFVAFVRSQGKIGATAQVLGQGLTGSTSVTFNGVPALSFTVVTDTYMTAVVPSGATTGPVVVMTPLGPLTSNVSFRVSQ